MDIPAGLRAGIVVLKRDGAGGSVSLSVDRDGPLEPLLTVDGTYLGAVAFGLSQPTPDGSAIEVRGSGDWTVTVGPLSSGPAISDTQEGDGSRAYLVEGPASLAFEHQGIGSVTVLWTTAGGTEALLADSGDLTQTVAIGAEPGVLSVQSSGAWSVIVMRR